MNKKISLQEQANKILEQAEKTGVQSNFFFVTTFKRYQVQMQILTQLEKVIQEEGPVVTKEYVKGRKNLTSNPAINDYNKTATAANGTVATLINIIKTLANTDEGAGLADTMKELLADE